MMRNVDTIDLSDDLTLEDHAVIGLCTGSFRTHTTNCTELSTKKCSLELNNRCLCGLYEI